MANSPIEGLASDVLDVVFATTMLVAFASIPLLAFLALGIDARTLLIERLQLFCSSANIAGAAVSG